MQVPQLLLNGDLLDQSNYRTRSPYFEVGAVLRDVEDSERASSARFDWLWRLTLSILDRYGPRALAIPNAVSVLETRGFGFDSHRPLQSKKRKGGRPPESKKSR